MMIIDDNELIDDLQFNNLKILQKKDGFKFGMDALLLTKFSLASKKSKYIDLGSGTGIIPIILSGIFNIQKVDALEIQENMVEMMRRSINMNLLNEKINIVQGDIKNISKYFKSENYEVVVSNPPYKVVGSGYVNEKDEKTIARHEILCTLNDVVKAASYLLKYGGSLNIVHKPERLVDIFCTMRKYKIEPKYIQMVCPREGEKPSLVLVKGNKGGNPQLNFLENIILYDNKNNLIWSLER